MLEIIAVAAYAYAAWQLASIHQNRWPTIAAISLAVSSQGLAIGMSGIVGDRWVLDVGAALNLFLWQCCAVHVLLSLRNQLWHLGKWLWPLSGFGIVLGWILPQGSVEPVAMDAGIRAHVILSLLAYAALTLAALQTISYATLDNSLHAGQHKHGMPPLQVMEELVFRLVSIGFVLLCTSIASGFLFVDNFFAQHLAHKTVLSIIACLLFGALAAGRALRGWRGRTAVRWVLWAYIALLLAYFGSKVVLELVLGRSWS